MAAPNASFSPSFTRLLQQAPALPSVICAITSTLSADLRPTKLLQRTPCRAPRAHLQHQPLVHTRLPPTQWLPRQVPLQTFSPSLTPHPPPPPLLSLLEHSAHSSRKVPDAHAATCVTLAGQHVMTFCSMKIVTSECPAGTDEGEATRNSHLLPHGKPRPCYITASVFKSRVPCLRFWETQENESLWPPSAGLTASAVLTRLSRGQIAHCKGTTEDFLGCARPQPSHHPSAARRSGACSGEASEPAAVPPRKTGRRTLAPGSIRLGRPGGFQLPGLHVELAAAAAEMLRDKGSPGLHSEVMHRTDKGDFLQLLMR